ncbi:MAG: type II toxin-antitoxin system PemK/MazF family toxin [Phycicoccus sp.]|nr:type II toxin-antitoxin system PemK/MazF family toxin [Phycicoccus sp.]NMM34399.1 type II toxin-antitoxin system PemK/MazF family toxin [Phycicoccus sp.]
MQRGEVRLIDLEPARGGEANKRRPAIIVSNDRANATADRLRRGVVTVVPVTSNTTHVFPFQVLLRATATDLRADSKAQAEQVRSVTVERVGPVLGRVPPQLMAEVDQALRLHLQLSL